MSDRLFPYPLLSAALLIAWLLIADSVSAGQILLGALFAIAIPWASRRLHPERPRIRGPAALLRLIPVVLWDIVVANFEVARLVLGRASRLRSQFIELPLNVSDPYAVTLLAEIITLTPGTVSAELSSDRKTLMIHALHVTDAGELVHRIKQRYEAPLKEIFECST
ncbi:MAG TPA: Na+/H+ antiporter subunit E [Burkholderiales bacterium]|nr:Na+/H+ antiporter subunit E [Burkholderiales bacterium]